MSSTRLALFTDSKEFRGVERVLFTLVRGLADRGHQVDLLTGGDSGPHMARAPAQVNVVRLRPDPGWLSRLRTLAADSRAGTALLRPFVLPLRAPRAVCYLRALVSYLQRARPTALLAAKTHPNLVALWARRLAGVSTRVVISEHVYFSRALEAHTHRWRWRYVLPVIRRCYPWADACVAVSDGVAADLSRCALLPRSRITTIYNPLMTDDILRKVPMPLLHPWFAAGAPPVILGAGKLNAHKDFPTLLRAFARVRVQHPARLMILGEGPHRAELERLARTLDIVADTSMPGFVENPYAYMARAAVFALSSSYEGLPTVLIEALACGCPVVSTDCPSGPREILDKGKYGRLVSVGDDAALAQAICDTLNHVPPREKLIERARFFSVDRAVEQYCRVLLER